MDPTDGQCTQTTTNRVQPRPGRFHLWLADDRAPLRVSISGQRREAVASVLATSTASVHVIIETTGRLILRSAATGAVVELIAGTGMFVITYAQAALDSARFAGWSVNPRQSVTFA